MKISSFPWKIWRNTNITTHVILLFFFFFKKFEKNYYRFFKTLAVLPPLCQAALESYKWDARFLVLKKTLKGKNTTFLKGVVLLVFASFQLQHISLLFP